MGQIKRPMEQNREFRNRPTHIQELGVDESWHYNQREKDGLVNK